MASGHRPSLKTLAFRSPAPRVTPKQIKAVIRNTAETKWNVHQFNAEAISSTGTFVDMTNFASGADYDKRDGNKVYVKSLHISGMFKCAATDENNILRLMVGVAKGTPATTAPTSFWATPQYKTSYVKHDKIYESYLSNASAGVTGVSINLKIKIKQNVIWADETASAPFLHQVWIGLLSDSDALTHPTFTGHATLWYKDV